MTLVFDGACFGDGPITGVGRAFLNALTAYAQNSGDRCVLLVPRGAPVAPLAGVEFVAAPRGALRRQFALPHLLRQVRADVLHSPVAAVPLRAPCPTIATVHDLPWLHPELEERTTAWRRLATGRALRAASAIVSPSAFTAGDVGLLLGTDAPPVHVIPHGTELGEEPRPGSTALRSGPLLVLGDDRPRKNRDRVRRAHAFAALQRRSLPPLRFLGPPDDYVEEAEKLRLLRTCTAVVQCSLFEGFGMPVLEAMSQGAPVVCADIPPFREIAGDAAVFVNPRNVAAIAAGLLRITDPASSTALVHAAWERAGSFRSQQTAERWQLLHRQLVGR